MTDNDRPARSCRLTGPMLFFGINNQDESIAGALTTFNGATGQREQNQ